MDWLRYWALIKSEDVSLHDQKLSDLHNRIMTHTRIKLSLAEDTGSHGPSVPMTVTVVSCAKLKDLETISKSDPYVKLMLKTDGSVQTSYQHRSSGKKQKFKTKTKPNNLNPEYGETFEFQTIEEHWETGEFGATLAFEVWDESVPHDKMMGKIEIPLSQLSTPPSGATEIMLLSSTGKEPNASSKGFPQYGSLTYIVEHQYRERLIASCLRVSDPNKKNKEVKATSNSFPCYAEEGEVDSTKETATKYWFNRHDNGTIAPPQECTLNGIPIQVLERNAQSSTSLPEDPAAKFHGLNLDLMVS